MRVWWLALVMGVMLTGCATPSRTAKPLGAEQVHASEWQGRISVQVLGDAPSSMSASFLLRGDGGKHQYFHSLAELTEKATGAALPVEAIFAWLQGQPLQASGWQADLSGVSQGSLSARRTDPAPEVTLRIKLDP